MRAMGHGEHEIGLRDPLCKYRIFLGEQCQGACQSSLGLNQSVAFADTAENTDFDRVLHKGCRS